MTLRTALVITTYNNPEFLGICLKSFANQTEKNFDIFIADDGSTAATRQKIQSLEKLFPQKIRHYWHEDTGYNKSKINNDVFRELKDYDVILCVDGDTIAHHRFIEDHLSLHKHAPRLLFMGRRIDLGPKLTQSLNEKNIQVFNSGLRFSLLRSYFSGETPNLSRAIRLTQPWLQKIFRRNHVADLLGSNYSISRELMFEVNGYNEDFKSYWGEDGDLFIRVRNAGAKIIGLKSFAIQYHLFHKRLEPSKQHEEIYEKLLDNHAYTRCKNGIFKENSL